MQADESKVKALESIFGGQDITASVIRTVLTTNENKFDDAVDSLLNMTNSNESAKEAEVEEELEDEEALLDKKEREKIKTLENMFGGDLSNSVIYTVLESNKGELVDTVDTLLNMTSKDINPYYVESPKREVERARQEEDLKNYEEFKRLQFTLQEEEVRSIKEQQKRLEEEARKSLEAAALEEQKRKNMLLEQERMLQEAKQRQAQAVAKEEQARKQAELREIEEAKEQFRKSYEEKMKLLAEEEAAKSAEEAKRKAEEEARRQQLLGMEENLRRKAAEQEERIARARMVEEEKLAQRRAQMEADMHRQALLEEAEAKKRAHQRRLDEEQQLAQRLRVEEEHKAAAHRLEQQRLELQRAKAELEEMRQQQQEKERREAEEKLRQVRLEQEEKLRRERLEKERMENELKLAREEEECQRAIEAEALRRAEEERLRLEAERIKAEEEALRIELDRQRQEQEEAMRIEEEKRTQMLREVAEKQQAAIEEERRKKEVYDQLAASAVFVPPKDVQSGDKIVIATFVSADTVTCDWDLPEGIASPTNWIGLYPVRALFNTNKYVQFVYTNGAQSGQHVFRGVTPGQYEVRFFTTRGYEHAARSDQMRVGPAATLFSQLQGETLLVYYTLDPLSTTPSREWLGIYLKGTRRNKEYISTAYGNAEGKVMMKAPRTPGAYEVRLFATGAVYNEQCKCEFVVEDNDCVTVEPTSLMAGANVTINWVMRTVDPSSGDWVGLYRADEANNSNYLSSNYTQGASVGSVTVQAPKEVGVYEVRLFSRAKGKYTTFRTSAPLTVV